MSKRRNHDAAFKARVALEAVKGEPTVSALAAECGDHPTMCHSWKRSLLAGAAGVFERGGKAAVAAEVAEETVRDLHAKIGERAVANVSCHESSSPGPASEAGHDREEPPKPVGRGARSAAVDLAVVVLRRPAGRDGNETRSDAADRQAVPGHSVLPRRADDVAPAERRPRREPETHPAADAADAPHASDADLPDARHQPTREGAQDLPLSAGRAAGGAAQPGQVAPISPACPCERASSISWPSWTSSPARRWPGASPTRWRQTSASRR